MPAAIDTQVKKQVINQWLSGESRDRIAVDNDIGAGTVSNIINDWKKGVEDSEYNSLRELAVSLKKQGIGLNDLARSVRLNNYIKNIGTTEDQIESFIVNLANSPEPEKLIEVANQVTELSRSESIPLEDLRNHIKHKEEEKQRLEEQIQEASAILQSKNVDIETIREYKQLEERLSKHNLSLEDPTRLLSILLTIKEIGYEPQKIVAAFASMKSLRQKERQIKNNCEMLEKRMAADRQVLPLLQGIRSMGIGIDQLLPFSLLVNEKAQTNNLPISTAAYRVIDDIENYGRIGGLKKEISRLAVQIYGMNEICAPRNKAITSLLKLQGYGISDQEVLNVYEYLNRTRSESAATIQR
jgi:DNA-binding ferritin-like protein